MSELESEIKQPVTKSLSPGYDADLIYDFFFLNPEYDIKLLLTLRSELATMVAKAYEELWTRFVKSTGYSSTI